MTTDIQPSATSPRKIKPSRVSGFATYFKEYMDLSSVVTAALPIPVTALHLIPTYKAYTGLLSTYTPLFCFLLLSYVFYIRHQLAWLYFGGGPTFAPKRSMTLLPAGLIRASLILLFSYQIELRNSLITVQNNFHSSAFDSSSEKILNTTDYRDIPDALESMALYLGMFLTAELAFIVMATREYLQDEIGIPETELFGGVGTRPAPEAPLCIVFFSSEPSGAIVYIDKSATYTGYTPVSARIAVGVHEVRLKAYGYEDWQGALEVKTEDRTLDFPVALKKL